MDENKIKLLIENARNVFDFWYDQGYVTSEFMEYRDKVEELFTELGYPIKEE